MLYPAEVHGHTLSNHFPIHSTVLSFWTGGTFFLIIGAFWSILFQLWILKSSNLSIYVKTTIRLHALVKTEAIKSRRSLQRNITNSERFYLCLVVDSLIPPVFINPGPFGPLMDTFGSWRYMLMLPDLPVMVSPNDRCSQPIDQCKRDQHAVMCHFVFPD